MNKSDKGFWGVIFLIVLIYLFFIIYMLKAWLDTSADNHICKLYGGIYVKVYDGFECIKDNKVINVERNSYEH